MTACLHKSRRTRVECCGVKLLSGEGGHALKGFRLGLSGSLRSPMLRPQGHLRSALYNLQAGGRSNYPMNGATPLADIPSECLTHMSKGCSNLSGAASAVCKLLSNATDAMAAAGHHALCPGCTPSTSLQKSHELTKMLRRKRQHGIGKGVHVGLNSRHLCWTIHQCRHRCVCAGSCGLQPLGGRQSQSLQVAASFGFCRSVLACSARTPLRWVPVAHSI
jgi:hypothetical protein